MRHGPSILAALIAASPPALAAASSPTAPAAMPAGVQQPPAIAPLGEDRRISAEDIDKHLASGKTLLLDVREPKELEELGTIEGAVNIPLGQLEKRLGEIPKDCLILTA